MKINWKAVMDIPFNTITEVNGLRAFRSSSNRFQCEVLAVEVPAENVTRFRLVSPEFKRGIGQTATTTLDWFAQVSGEKK
jgi:hypothetical protein